MFFNKSSGDAMLNPGSLRPLGGRTRQGTPPTGENGCRKNGLGKSERQDWKALDLGGQGMRALSNSLFRYTFLDKLYINHNRLTSLPPAIGQLKLLQLLDASENQLTYLPPELGMLTDLEKLNLDDNHLTTLPNELGALYRLGVLGLERNPIRDDLKWAMIKGGPAGVITTLRESLRIPLPPAEREWITLDETYKDDARAQADTFQVLCYNILCEKYATQNMYGYSPSWALAWDYRKNLIRSQLVRSRADIICLQEVDLESFNDFFMPQLAAEGYKGAFYPKSRAKTMNDSEKQSVDGCATFFKSTKFSLLAKKAIDFNSSAIQCEDLKKTADLYNRVMPRDNIALFTFLENNVTGSRLVVANAHTFWDPEYKDVKLVQVGILMDELAKWADIWAKSFPSRGLASSSSACAPSPPAVQYASLSHVPFLICGDFNSTPDSGVYELLSTGNLARGHGDFAGNTYGDYTAKGMSHPFSLKSSYSNIGELKFTNYTPGFTGVIDYIWYTANNLTVTGLAGDVDMRYLARVPGFPHIHFPSDHIPLQVEFQVRPQKKPLARPPPPVFSSTPARNR